MKFLILFSILVVLFIQYVESVPRINNTSLTTNASSAALNRRPRIIGTICAGNIRCSVSK